MVHLRRRIRPFAAAAALSVALVACGGGDGDTAQEAGTETTATTDTQTTPETTDTETGTETETEGQQGEGDFAVPVKSSGDPFADLRGAAEHVVMSAETLSGGIATAAGMQADPSSEASGLHATLSALLQEHVYLAGITLDTGATFGFDSQEFELAAAQLDENSVKLADAVGSVSDQEKRDAFLDLWRQHIGFFVDYTMGAAEGDQAKQDEAKQNLDQYRQDAGAFFEEVTGGALPADAVAENLSGHVQTVFAAIDAVAAGDTAVFDRLKQAAEHVNGSAETLAGGIAEATGMEGDVAADATGLRATLTELLQEHVYLAGIAVKTAYMHGPDSEMFNAAAQTLDQNSQELSQAVGSVAGEEKAQAFLDLWRQHIGFFVDFAVGAAGDDEQAKQQAISDLQGYTKDAGAFFEEITGGELPQDAVAGALEEHISTLAGAIESLSGVEFPQS
jgi:cytochrome c556